MAERQEPTERQNQISEALGPMRQYALLALDDLASEAKGYEDQTLRVRVKAQIADAIWSIHPERAEDLISAALDDALALKIDSTARYALRSEIIGIARRHDPDLAAKMIARLYDKADENGALLTRDSVERISERGALYVESARDLLRGGNQEQALTLVRRSFTEGRSATFIWFLTELRERDQAAADKLFLEALSALRQGTADPNDVLFFGLYVFYPGSVAVGNLSDGVEAVSYGVSFSAAASPSIALIQPYLRAAAEALVRFQVVIGQPGPVGSVELKRFAFQQLMPLFERYDPERAAALRVELVRLGPTVARPATTSEDTGLAFDHSLSTENLIADIERLAGTSKRDHYFFDAAKRAFDQGDFKRARTMAARISDHDLNQTTLGLIAFKDAQTSIKRGEFVEAARIAASQLKREQRAIIYFQLASARSERRDYAGASEEVNAAVAEAGKTEDRALRARVFAYLAAGIAKQDVIRAFELIEAAVKDINAVEGFNPSDDQLTFELRTPLGVAYRFVFSEGGSFLAVLPHLALVDPYRTISLARSLRAPGARALAVITACRALLVSNNKPTETEKAKPADEKANETKESAPAAASQKKKAGEKN